MIKRVEDSLPPKEAIHRFLDEIIERSVSDRERRGCFLINSALEVAPHDSELGEFIADRFGEIAVVDVPPAMDGHVHHRQRLRPALLHRAVFATRLRELYARRRHATDPARDLDRRGLSRFPSWPTIRQAGHSVRELRVALEP